MPWMDRYRNKLWFQILANLCLVIVYFIAGKYSLELATINNNASPVWPPTGIAIASLILFGRFMAPGVFLGATLVNLNTGGPPFIAIVIAVGNTFEALVGHFLFDYFKKFKSIFSEYNDSIAVPIAVAVGALCSATIGIGVLTMFSVIPVQSFLPAWITWWGGDLIGGLLVVPLFLLLKEQKTVRYRGGQTELFDWLLPFKILLTVIISCLCTLAVFKIQFANGYIFLIFPLLILSLWLSGNVGLKLSAFSISAVAIWETALREGPFTWGTQNENLIAVQLFVISIGLSSLMIYGFNKATRFRVFVPILLAGWLLTGLVFLSFFESQAERDSQAWQRLQARAQDRIVNRLHTYEETLRATAGLYASSQHVNRQEFRLFVNTLDIVNRYPGINGIGAIYQVRKKEFTNFYAGLKNDGVDQFVIRPVPQVPPEYSVAANDLAYVITYIEPLTPNKLALGLDIGTEKNRKEAAELARDTGKSVLTANVSLVQDNVKRGGFLLFYPVYKNAANLHTVEERRKAFSHWIYAPFIVENFLEGVLGELEGQTEYAIYENDYKSLLYASTGETFWQKPEMSALLINHLKFGVSRIKIFQHEYQVIWKKGQNFVTLQDYKISWIGALGALIVLLVTLMAANSSNQRNRAEELVNIKTQELSVREKTWRTLMENAPVGIFQSNRKGELTYANEKWCEITGLTQAQALGNGWIQNLHRDDFQLVFESWVHTIDKGEKFERSFRIQTTNSEIKTVQYIADRIASDTGETVAYVGICVDVSQEIVRGQQVEMERLRSAQAAKMASLGEMAGGISHEINNPLAIIIGRASLLIEESESATSQLSKPYIMEQAMKIESTAMRISKIIKGLRSFARNGENDPFVAGKFNHVLQDTLELCRERFKGNDIRLDVAGDFDFEVNMQSIQISQVLLNLLNNAFDAVDKTENAWVEVKCEQFKDSAVVHITDSGAGISEKIQSRIMEPFFTTKDVGKGTGLGLSIAKGIIDQHQGKIWLETASNNTRFSIRLPKATGSIALSEIKKKAG